MVTCPRMKNTTVPESTCIARQKIIRKGERSYLYKNGAYYDCYYSCHGCRVGLALLRDSGQKTTKSEQYRQRLAEAAKRRVEMKRAEKKDKATAVPVPAENPAADQAGGTGGVRTDRDVKYSVVPGCVGYLRRCSGCSKGLPLTTQHFRWCGKGYSRQCLTCLANKKAGTGFTRPVAGKRKPEKANAAANAGTTHPLQKQSGGMTISITIDINIDRHIKGANHGYQKTENQR